MPRLRGIHEREIHYHDARKKFVTLAFEFCFFFFSFFPEFFQNFRRKACFIGLSASKAYLNVIIYLFIYVFLPSPFYETYIIFARFSSLSICFQCFWWAEFTLGLTPVHLGEPD